MTLIALPCPKRLSVLSIVRHVFHVGIAKLNLPANGFNLNLNPTLKVMFISYLDHFASFFHIDMMRLSASRGIAYWFVQRILFGHLWL